MIATIKNGHAEIRDDRGSLKRTIASSGAIAADADDDYVVIAYQSGRVELRSAKSGSLIRNLATNGAVGASINAGNAVIVKSSGTTEIRRLPSGTLIRTI